MYFTCKLGLRPHFCTKLPKWAGFGERGAWYCKAELLARPRWRLIDAVVERENLQDSKRKRLSWCVHKIGDTPANI